MEEPNPDFPQHCLNCEFPLSPEAQFCSACGQKRTTGRITFKQLLSDFIENVFNLDSRTFLTWRKLLIPGFLTVAYFKGKHKTYLHPFRIFLVALLALVAAIGWMLNDGIAKDGDIFSRMSNARIERNMVLEVDSLNQIFKTQKGTNSLTTELDSLKKEVYRRNGLKGDSIDLDNFFTFANEDFPPIGLEDLFSLNAEELIKEYHIEGIKRKFIFRQKMKVMRDSRSFLRFLIGRFSWMALILMPLAALGLKMLYWRKTFYYVEHFIFSIHIHSVFFALGALQLLFINIVPLWTIGLTSGIFVIYFILAMRRFYQQNWIKTLLKFFILASVIYWFAITVSFIIAILLGILLF